MLSWNYQLRVHGGGGAHGALLFISYSLWDPSHWVWVRCATPSRDAHAARRTVHSLGYVADSVLGSYSVDEKVLLSYVGDIYSECVRNYLNEIVLNLVKFKHLHLKCTFNVVLSLVKGYLWWKMASTRFSPCQAIVRWITARFSKHILPVTDIWL